MGYERVRRVLYRNMVQDIPMAAYNILQAAMFMQIWRECEHRCWVSGERIYSAHTYNFHHILEKRNYEEYALCKWNIVLLDRRVHDRYESKPDNVVLLVALKNKLISKLESNDYKYDNDCLWQRRGGINYARAILGG